MQVLTKETLDAAVKKCKESERYRVLIMTKYAGDHARILDYLSQVGADVVRCFGHPWARFLMEVSLICYRAHLMQEATRQIWFYIKKMLLMETQK